MTRKKKWAQLTDWVESVNSIMEHYHQFRKHKDKDSIKTIHKKDKFAIFIIPEKEETLTQEERKKIFKRYMGL